MQNDVITNTEEPTDASNVLTILVDQINDCSNLHIRWTYKQYVRGEFDITEPIANWNIEDCDLSINGSQELEHNLKLNYKAGIIELVSDDESVYCVRFIFPDVMYQLSAEKYF